MWGLDEILQGHIIMEGEAHNSMGLAGCCPNMILPACSNLRALLKRWWLRGNELRINLHTYQDISESAGVQGDFTNLFGSWRSAALAAERPPLIWPCLSAWVMMRFFPLHLYLKHTFLNLEHFMIKLRRIHQTWLISSPAQMFSNRRRRADKISFFKLAADEYLSNGPILLCSFPSPASALN